MNSERDLSQDRLLKSAIVLNWLDLMQDAQTGLIHIEYGFAGGRHRGLSEDMVIGEPRSLASGL